MTAKPRSGEPSAWLVASGGPLFCLSLMTLGLGIDHVQGRYPSLALCSDDASILRMITVHVALLPMGCLAIYVATAFALCVKARTHGGRRRSFVAIGELSLVTAQIGAGAIIMDSPKLAFAGDGYIRAWFSMALAMVAAHAGQRSLFKIDALLRGKRHANI